MPLDEYRAKRDFTRSPEPAGAARPRPRRGKRFFCVQKHLATQLHYDLRLEHDGVLLSWAIPRGPSIDPADRRLAVQVEDHPVEYGDFEGVIPDGYGAGVVMLWDRGTWEPEADDVDAALAKGDLKLTLDGFKLKGSWALVRTRGWRGAGRARDAAGPDDGRSWLLIKHRDDWSGPLDITTFAPQSVKSGGGFGDILTQELPAVWTSSRRTAGTDLAASLSRIVEKVEKLEGRLLLPRSPDEASESHPGDVERTPDHAPPPSSRTPRAGSGVGSPRARAASPQRRGPSSRRRTKR